MSAVALCSDAVLLNSRGAESVVSNVFNAQLLHEDCPVITEGDNSASSRASVIVSHRRWSSSWERSTGIASHFMNFHDWKITTADKDREVENLSLKSQDI